MEPKTMRFDPARSVRGLCRCGRVFEVGYLDDGEPAAVHAEPACPEFLAKEPATYLAWVRIGKTN